jgi:pimeloyl-ACP methyl ester carboxylesterase
MSGGRHWIAGGTRVYVEEWGSGPTLVCLHGLGGGAHFFATLGAALQDRYRTIALDLPGAGFSPALPQFSFDAIARIVADLAATIAAPPLCVIGHSMGTIVALETFRLVPGLARGFIALGGLSDPLPGARSRIAERVGEIKRTGMAGLGPSVAMANLSRQTIDERPEIAALLARLFELQSPDGYLATAEALASWEARQPPPLDAVRCLAVTGEHDVYAPPDAVRAFAATLPPGTDVQVIAGAAHLPFFEQPAALAAIVSKFLETLPRQTRLT